MNDETITLTPRGWQPDFTRTGGNIAPQQLFIPRSLWDELGRPDFIEGFYDANSKRCTCHPLGCPVHGFMGSVDLGILKGQP